MNLAKLQKKQLFFYVTLLSLSLVAAVTIAWFFSFQTGFGNMFDAQKLLNQKASQYGLVAESEGLELRLSLADERVRMEFLGSPDQKEDFISLSKNLNLNPQWLEGVSFEVDSDSARFLEGYLPITARLIPENNKIIIKGSKSLNVHEVESNIYDYSVGSSSIRIDAVKNGFSVSLNNPTEALKRIDKDGKISLAESLTGGNFWQVVAKLDRMNITLSKGSIDGEIVFK